MSTIASGNTTTTAFTVTGDTTGNLVFTTGGANTTALTITNAQAATFAGTLTTASQGIAFASLPTGSVLQVVQANYSTSTSSSTSTYVDTGLTATITPKFSTSKILVVVHQNGVAKNSSDTAVNLKLLRGSTDISQISVFGGRTSSSGIINIGSCSVSYLDSPATTSATTYKTQFNSYSNTAAALVQEQNVMSTITLMEIAA